MSDQSNDRAPCFAVENGSYGTYDPRMLQRKVRIKIEHRIEYPDPLRVAAGERVNVGHEDAEFPGWKWCKASDGREGWVPVELLSNEGAETTVLQDYSARELAVRPGEEVLPAANFPLKADECSLRKSAHTHKRKVFAIAPVSH